MALKVIELEIDDSLTGDTKVEEIALVLQPAIETEFVYFSEQQFQESYTDYPEAVKKNAQNVLAYTKRYGWGTCGTSVGKQRANQLAKGEPISLDTIQRMYSYLVRHRKDLLTSKTYDEQCGKLMYDAWGGEEALRWSERKLRQLKTEMGYDTSSLKPWSQTTGDTEMCGCGGDMVVEEQFEEPCWEGYVMVGMKEKDGRMVPNCVPETELSAYELDVFGYKTKYFYICPGAQGTFKQIISVKPTENSIGMIRSAAVVADKIFEIESIVLKNRTATKDQLDAAKVLVEDFKDIIAEIEKIQNKTFDVSYMDGHIETIASYIGRQEMEIEPDCGCGCWNDGIVVDPESNLYFENILINGVPVFESEGEAATYAETMGCNGAHEHVIDGKTYYMPCEVHPPDINELNDYSEEEYEAAKLLKFLAETNYEQFEAVVGAMRGATEQEVYRRNHKNPTIYFKYERVLDGSPDRDFCVSIEGRYFRRLEIDLLRDYNTDFGHQRQPYSKWLYKGGPECVHAWRKFLFQGKNKVDEGFAEGKAGMPPKSMPNNGYYSEETKRRSQQAYIISQKENMSRQVKPSQFKYDGERRMIYSPAMKPGILIPRIDEVTKERYFVTFKPDTIERMAQRYMIDKKSGGGHTNYEHSEKKLEDVFLVESWIVDGEQDKAYSLGYTKQQIPKGTWMVGFRVDSPEVWEMVKSGDIKGISIEGNFEYKFSSQKTEGYLLDEIINIINQIQ